MLNKQREERGRGVEGLECSKADISQLVPEMNGRLGDSSGNRRNMNWLLWYNKYKTVDNIFLAAREHKSLRQYLCLNPRNMELVNKEKAIAYLQTLFTKSRCRSQGSDFKGC